MPSIDAMFDEILETGTPQEDRLTLCLHGEALAEWQALSNAPAPGVTPDPGAKAGEVDDTRMAPRRRGTARPKVETPGPDPATVARLAELESIIRRHTVTFRLKAIPSTEWNDLFAAHPPRRTATGEVERQDMLPGVNAHTFFHALIPRSIFEPTMSAKRWEKLRVLLSDGQLDHLGTVAWNLNRRNGDTPFGPAS